MKKLVLSDIGPLDAYLARREEATKEIIAVRARRRVLVGDRVSFSFENRETVRYQVQEMCRVEHLREPAQVQAELDVYNPLVPDDGALSATMFLEYTDPSTIRQELARLLGIDSHVWLVVGDSRIPAQFEPGRQSDFKLSSVQYVAFSLTPAARTQLAGATPAALLIDHPNYSAMTKLTAEIRAELVADLR